MKKVLPLAIAAALVAPTAAMADATIYGKVRQGIDMVTVDLGNDTPVDEIQINDKTSRIGFKGSEDLGDGLTAVWKMEFGVNISGGGNGGDFHNVESATTVTQLTYANEFSGGSCCSNRNAFVGLAGGFGTVVVGRHDTPLKISTGSLDYFGDTVSDNNLAFTEALVDRRANGTLAYISPNFSGLTLAIALVPGEHTSVVPGDTEANGLADAYSMAAMYSNGGIYVSAALEGADGNIDAIGVDGADLTQMRFGAGYDAGMWKVAGVYENMKVDNPGAGDDLVDTQSFALNGAIKAGPGMAVLKYFSYKDDGLFDAIGNDSASKHSGFGIGYHYDLSKRTQLMANYVDSSYDNVDLDISILSFQINHNF